MKIRIEHIVRLLLIPLALGVDPSWAAGVYGLTSPLQIHAVWTGRSQSGLVNSQALEAPLDAGFEAGRKAAISVREGADSLLFVRRRSVLRLGAVLALIPFIPASLLAKDKKSSVKPPQISRAEGASAERVNIELTKEQAEGAWDNVSDVPAQIKSFNDLLNRIIARNPKIKGDFLEQRAAWSDYLSMLRGEGKSLGVASNDTHTTQETLYQYQADPKKPVTHDLFRDTMAISGVTVSRPLHTIETFDGPKADRSSGFWHRLIKAIFDVPLKIVGGIQVVSPNTANENKLQNLGQAVNANKSYAVLGQSTLEIIRNARNAWFEHWIQERRVGELEAKHQLAEYDVKHEREQSQLAGVAPLTLDKLQDQAAQALGTVKGAKSNLEFPLIELAQITAHDQSDLTNPSAFPISIPAPDWSEKSLEREIPDLGSRLDSLIQSESYQAGPETLAKTIQEQLKTGNGITESIFDGSDPAGFPTLKELFSEAPADLLLGTTPKERQLELERSLLKTVQIEILKLQKQFHWKVGEKLNFDTSPYLLGILNFSLNEPAGSEKQSIDLRIQATEIRIKEISAEIEAEQISVRSDYLAARARRRDAFVALKATRQQIAFWKQQKERAKTDDFKHTVTLDQARVDLEVEVLNQESIRLLAEAAAAWKQMELLTVAGQKQIADALESHYIKTLEILNDSVPVTPGQLNPPISKSQRPISRRGFLSGKVIPGAVSATLLTILGLSSSLSAQTYSASPLSTAAQSAVQSVVQGPVSDAAQKVAVDVVIGQYTGGSSNTLSGVAVDILKASHQSISQKSIHQVAQQVADLNHLSNVDHIPQGTLHLGAFDPAVAHQLPGLHTVFASGTDHVAKAIPDVSHHVAGLVSHSGFWSDPSLWLGVLGVLIVTVAAVWLVRRYGLPSIRFDLPSRRWLLGISGAFIALFGLWYVPSSIKASNSSGPQVTVPASVEKPSVSESKPVSTVAQKAEKAKEDIAEEVANDYAVGVTRPRPAVTLPQDFEPGVVTDVNIHLQKVDPHQPIVAIEPPPFGDLIDEINAQWKELHPDHQGLLLDRSILGGSQKAFVRAPIHIKPFATENSTDGKIQKELIDLANLLTNYQYDKAGADASRRANGTSELSIPERNDLNQIDYAVANLRAFFAQRELLGVVYAGSGPVEIVGNLIQSGTPVRAGTVLFTQENKTILTLGLSRESMIALTSLPKTYLLKFADQEGNFIYIPLQDVRQITVPDGGVARPMDNEKETNFTFGQLNTANVSLEVDRHALPENSVLTFKGFFESRESKEPAKVPQRQNSIVGVIRLVSLPPPTTLRHDAAVPLLSQQLSDARKAAQKNQQLLQDVTIAIGDGTDSELLLRLKKDLEVRNEQLRSDILKLEAQIEPLKAGVSIPEPGKPPTSDQWAVPTDPSKFEDAGAQDRTRPSVDEKAEQVTVWRNGDEVRIQISADTTLASTLPGENYEVYLDAIGRSLPFHLIGHDNADRDIPFVTPTLEWRGTLGAHNGISLKELGRLFSHSPSESALTSGEIQLKMEVGSPMVKVWEHVSSAIPSWVKNLVSGAIALPSRILDWLHHPFALFSSLVLAVTVAFPMVRRRRSLRASLDEAPALQASLDSVPKPDDPGIISRVFLQLPSKLKEERAKLIASVRHTPLGPARLFFDHMEKIVGKRSIQHAIGWFLAWYLFVKPLWDSRRLFESFLHGLGNVNMVMPVLWENAIDWNVIKVTLFLSSLVFLAALQRSGENAAVNPTSFFSLGLAVLDYLIFIPIAWAIRHLRHEDTVQKRTDDIDAKRSGVLVDMARAGRFFLQNLLEKVDADPKLAVEVLKAFEAYNQKRPDRHRVGSGLLEIISPDQTRFWLSAKGVNTDSLPPDKLETARAKYTLIRSLTKNSLAIRGLLALTWSGLVVDALPDPNPVTLVQDTALGYNAQESIDALVKSEIYSQVSKFYRRNAPSRRQQAEERVSRAA
jgi:hypothetical protein